MAINFDANQYEGVFVPHKLQNWEVPKQYAGYCAVRPKSHEGFTEVIANNRGHIIEGDSKSVKNPWGDYIGTWDMPKKIPGNRATVATARRSDTQDKLQRHLVESQKVMTGRTKNTARQMKGKIRHSESCKLRSMMLPAGKTDHHGYHSVIIDPSFAQEQDNGPHKIYPKTHYPTEQQYRGLTPDSDRQLGTNGYKWGQGYYDKPASQQSIRYEKINAL